jgi:hypothetical protein
VDRDAAAAGDVAADDGQGLVDPGELIGIVAIPRVEERPGLSRIGEATPDEDLGQGVADAEFTFQAQGRREIVGRDVASSLDAGA